MDRRKTGELCIETKLAANPRNKEEDASEPPAAIAAAISVGYMGILLGCCQSELQPRPPIRAEWEGQATNWTPAMKRTYLHNSVWFHTNTEITELTRNSLIISFIFYFIYTCTKFLTL